MNYLSSLLGSSVFDELGLWFKKPAFIVGLVLCVIGVTLAVLARRIARVVRKKNDIDDNDKCYLTLKVVSVVMLFVALLIFILM